mgnify:CR=1 FL=1
MSAASANELPSRPSPGAAGARLGELYTDHSRLVYGICRMLLRDPDEAEDATQQVFLSAYRNLLTGTEVRDPAAWLGTIARNACRRRAIARMREPLAVEEEVTLLSPAADEQAVGREQAAALYAEVAALPEKQREAVVLRDLYGLRYDEVAAALGTSRPAVEALLFRGRRRLQHRLRPGFAAGVLVVPLAVQESIAYAVPGFASTAVPAGAVATAAGIPILAKLAAAGAAVTIAGSAGFSTEQAVRDSPPRPADTPIAADATAAPPLAAAPMMAASLLPQLPTAAHRPAGAQGKNDGAEDGQERREEENETKASERHEDRDEPEREDAHAAGDSGDEHDAEEQSAQAEQALEPDHEVGEDASAASETTHDDEEAEPAAEQDHNEPDQAEPEPEAEAAEAEHDD